MQVQIEATNKVATNILVTPRIKWEQLERWDSFY